MAPAVLVKNLKKSYGNVEAVKDVSFAIEPGEIFGLLGPNGAGKTTTIRCLCTLMTPDAGQLEINGISVLEDPRAARQMLGYIAQEVALDKVLTGRELLELQAAIYHLPKAKSRDRIAQMLALLEIEDIADKKNRHLLRRPKKKRLDLAAGLLHQPAVLVLDEPTVGLDIESRTAVWNFFAAASA